MAKRKELKQNINIVCGDLFAECIATSLYASNMEKDSVNNILASILVFHDDFIRRVSQPEPGMRKKDYFMKLKTEFARQASEIVDQINAIG